MPEMLARYENKYLIDARTMATIRDWARTFCEPDAYGVDGVYGVNSLYLDTTSYTLAHQTLEGIRNRRKFRIRTYGWEATDPVFLEIKARVGTSIIKQRALMDRKYVQPMVTGQLPPDTDYVALKSSHQDDLIRFRNGIDEMDLRPRLWVRYVREAYQSAFGDGARLTFDTALEVQVPDEERPFVPTPEDWCRVPLDGHQNILEMKYNGAFPVWMLRIARSLQLHRLSCSKYVQGAMLTGHLPFATLERGLRWTAF
jgi:SPX domain protein involved in polyphosphate accumulation